MNRILFPTDFSSASENALRTAAWLAQDLSARIDILHVYHLPFMDASNVPADYLDDMLSEKERLVYQRLEELAAGVEREVLGSLKAVYGLFIPEEIQDQVKKEGYDLIVMGTRGENHRALEKTIGSITTHTMMAASCPVLAVPEEFECTPLRRFAFATDFEPGDEPAVRQLQAIAAKLQADVHFVHVETKPSIGPAKSVIRLEHYPFRDADFSIINDVDILKGLDTFIRNRKIDVLSLYIPHRRLWERLFHNSFSKKMTFHTRIPLLVFHQ
ncbi:MAG: hypothetical protein RLY31_3138 [Bacteroidota bacterium]